MSSIPEIVDILERRRKPRFKCDYPARIRGHDVNGKSFLKEGRAVNLSRTGVYILMDREITQGAELTIRITFPDGLFKQGTTILALHGTVLRCEFHSENLYGVAIQFQKYRFV
jgi:hypothetical protein